MHKQITFKKGFVRVRKGAKILEEGWAANKDEGTTFQVPPHCDCEVLGGPDFMFTRVKVQVE